MPLISIPDRNSRNEPSQSLRAHRTSLPAKQAAHPEAAVAEWRVAGCVAVREEANLRTALESATTGGEAMYLPLVTTEMALAFEPWHPGAAMHNNRFGILQPDASDLAVAAATLDPVIVPLVAFDASGIRRFSVRSNT